MEVNWEAITSISTVFLTLFTLGLMLATIWLAIIALQAKNTWKEEHKERKKLDILRETKMLLNNLYVHLSTAKVNTNKHLYSYEQIKDYLRKLHRLLEQLLNLQDELMCINCEIFSGALLEIITKGNNSLIFQKIFAGPIENITSLSEEEVQESEIVALLKRHEELMSLIEKSTDVCNQEIKKFYTK